MSFNIFLMQFIPEVSKWTLSVLLQGLNILFCDLLN